MNMRAILLLLILLGAGCGCASVPEPPNISAYAYHIVMGMKSCSASAVGPNTILTAEHCLDGDKLITINGTEAGVLHIEVDGQDHALIKVTTTFPVWAKLADMPPAGSLVEYNGNPQQFTGLYRRGYVSGRYMESYIVDINTGRGDSGSGLFHEGRLVGVVSGITKGEFQVTGVFPLRFSREQWGAVL